MGIIHRRVFRQTSFFCIHTAYVFVNRGQMTPYDAMNLGPHSCMSDTEGFTITWTKSDILSVWPFGMKFSERWAICKLSVKKMHLKTFSGISGHFYYLNKLILQESYDHEIWLKMFIFSVVPYYDAYIPICWNSKYRYYIYGYMDIHNLYDNTEIIIIFQNLSKFGKPFCILTFYTPKNCFQWTPA